MAMDLPVEAFNPTHRMMVYLEYSSSSMSLDGVPRASDHPVGHVPDDVAFEMKGRVLAGRYEVGDQVARGGMAVVYSGVHLGIGRRIAFKFLLPRYSVLPAARRRFRNEARIASSLRCSSVVSFFDTGRTDEGILYHVMEFLDGRDLGHILRDAREIPVDWAVRVTIQALWALKAVHSSGVVHRDLKPGNLFLAEQPGGGWMVKIVDFGLSRPGPLHEVEPAVTNPGSVVGTPHYLAPEQAMEQETVDARADLYSIGVVLYRMLARRFPFEGRGYTDVILAKVRGGAVPVDTVRPDLPPGLADVVMRAMARDPVDRHPDAGAFVQALMPYA